MGTLTDAPALELGLGSGSGSDLALVAGAMALIAGLYAWMLRRQRPMLSVEPDGLQVDRRALPWSEVESLSYSRGSMGVLLRITTRHGLLAFREDQLIQHPDDVRRRIAAGAHLVRAQDVTIPKGLVHDPGDIYEEWRQPLPEDFAAASAGTAGPHRTSTPASTTETAKKTAIGFTALALLAAKFGKTAIVALKYLLGGAKLGGLLPTALTMLASVWVYAQLWGWWFAFGFMVLLLHELGHAAVIKAKGLRTSPIIFVPLFGAAIAMKDQFRDASVEAETAWGGPALGALSACACYLAFLFTGQLFWLHLSYFGFLLNSFNLLPLSPLDGGRVVTAISTWLWIPGLLVVGALAVQSRSPLLFIVVLMGAIRAVSDWRRRRQGLGGDYYDLTLAYRATISAAYFGLAGFLGWMTYHTHTLAQAARHG